MKYLESYKIFENNGDDMLFLNRDMIADLKDLCIDFIDKKLPLIIYFYSKELYYRRSYIGCVTINHEMNNYLWNNNIRSKDKIKFNKENIKYVWGIGIPNSIKISSINQYINKDDISEVDYRIKAMYPDEDINYSNSYLQI